VRGLSVARAARAASLKTQARNFLGTIRRIVLRRR
jgi:hypothetical protein